MGTIPYEKYIELEEKFRPYFLAEVIIWFPFGALKLLEISDFDCNAKIFGQPIIMWLGMEKSFWYLVELKDIKLNAVNNDNNCVLHLMLLACAYGCSMKDIGKRILKLLKKGANPNIQDNKGLTALHYAMLCKPQFKDKLVRILLLFGADNIFSITHHIEKLSPMSIAYHQNELSLTELMWASRRLNSFVKKVKKITE